MGRGGCSLQSKPALRVKEGRKGVVSMDAEIFQVTPTFHMVELKKCNGDSVGLAEWQRWAVNACFTTTGRRRRIVVFEIFFVIKFWILLSLMVKRIWEFLIFSFVKKKGNNILPYNYSFDLNGLLLHYNREEVTRFVQTTHTLATKRGRKWEKGSEFSGENEICNIVQRTDYMRFWCCPLKQLDSYRQ